MVIFHPVSVEGGVSYGYPRLSQIVDVGSLVVQTVLAAKVRAVIMSVEMDVLFLNGVQRSTWTNWDHV